MSSRSSVVIIKDRFIKDDPRILYNAEHLDIVLATGATASISPSLDNFVDGYVEPLQGIKMTGIGSSLDIARGGTIQWTVYDDTGRARLIKTPGYHVPALKSQLFSPQSYFQATEKKGKLEITKEGVVLHWKDGGSLSVGFQEGSLLPVMKGFSSLSIEYSKMKLYRCVTEVGNQI